MITEIEANSFSRQSKCGIYATYPLEDWWFSNGNVRLIDESVECSAAGLMDDFQQNYIYQFSDASWVAQFRPTAWTFVSTVGREIFEAKKAVRNFEKNSVERQFSKGSSLPIKKFSNVHLTSGFTEVLKVHENFAEPHSQAILETLSGTIDRIERDVAYLTIVGEDGKSLYGSYPAEKFETKNINIGEKFILKVIDFGRDVKFEIDRIDPVCISESEQLALWESLGEVFGDDSLWAADE